MLPVALSIGTTAYYKLTLKLFFVFGEFKEFLCFCLERVLLEYQW